MISLGSLVGGIDHAVFLVSDLDRSADRFKTLGFTLSPRGTHSASMGTANHTIIFADDYCELLSVISETPRNVQMRETLAERGDSFVMVAGRTEDIHASRTALSKLGIATNEVMEFSRPLPLPDGTTGTASFAITTFEEGSLPKGKWFLCEHKTRDMVWRPELMTHANGARGVAAILVITSTPEATARAYSRFFATGKIQTGEKGSSVTTGEKSAQIQCMTLATAMEHYSGITEAQLCRGNFGGLQIAVTDLKATQAHLQANRVEFGKSSDGNGIFVFPADAGGAILEFVQR